MLDELTHAIVDDSPGGARARCKIASHFEKRTRGEEITEEHGMPVLRDKWWTLYAGKPDGTELASYYVELLGHRPPVKEVLAVLKTWNRCEEWRKDGNAFVPALHRWIKNCQWENLPECSRRDPFARYRTTPKPLPATPPDQAATAEEPPFFRPPVRPNGCFRILPQKANS